MAINGIASITYGVNQLEECTRFYEDFGLKLERHDASGSDFSVPHGSTIHLRKADDPALPPDVLGRPATRELVWGVDTPAALEALGKRLAAGREVVRGADGTLHCTDSLGIPLGFRVFVPRPLEFAQVPTNTPTDARRRNANRKWYRQARPQLIHHVGYGVPEHEVQTLVDFYVDVLGFRVTDASRNFAVFLLADGRHDHHNIFIMKSEAMGGGGMLWHHAAYGVENIDEVAAGANYLQRRKWTGATGLSRHRISSAINFYARCPAGGEAEYLADIDYVDAEWKPRMWDPRFGVYMWNANIPEYMMNEPMEDVRVIEGAVPRFLEH
jgi:catechol 2,3-dioxygenase-like lactoylglutathione lyase family enzyme